MMLALQTATRETLVLVGAALATALLTPLAIRLAVRLGMVDHPAGHKFHREPTPFLGGLALGAAVLVAMVAGLATASHLRGQLVALTVGGAAMLAVGFVDDRVILNPAPRLLVQALAAAGLWTTGIRVAPTRIDAVDLALTVLTVLVITNAVNLIDNMDGISAGTVAIAAFFFFVAAHWQGQRLVSLMALALAGASVGFLAHNFPPARIFLGDAGTLFMGFLLAALAIKLKLVGFSMPTRIVVPVLFVAVPLFDTTLVVLSRWRGARPIFRGGTDHSSHRLVSMGAIVPVAVLITYAAGVSCGILGLVLLGLHSETAAVATAAGGLLVTALLLWRFEVSLGRHPAAALDPVVLPETIVDGIPGEPHPWIAALGKLR